MEYELVSLVLWNMILHYLSLIVCSKLHIRKPHRILQAEKLLSFSSVTHVLFQGEKPKTEFV